MAIPRQTYNLYNTFEGFDPNNGKKSVSFSWQVTLTSIMNSFLMEYSFSQSKTGRRTIALDMACAKRQMWPGQPSCLDCGPSSLYGTAPGRTANGTNPSYSHGRAATMQHLQHLQHLQRLSSLQRPGREAAGNIGFAKILLCC